MTAQTLGAGTTPAQWFRTFSAPQPRTVNQPTALLGMLAGLPSSGKTSFFLSCPDALILHFDRTSLPLGPTQARAGVWPSRDAEGNLVGPNGRLQAVTWESFEQVIQQLETAARNNQPRPAMVVLDTLAGMVDLLQKHVAQSMGRDSWRACDGRQAWDILYGTVLDTLQRLRSVGYGVWITCHIVDKLVNLDGSADTTSRVLRLTITDNFWSRLFWMLEASYILADETVTETTVTVQSLPGGRTREIRQPQHVRRRVLITDRPEHRGILKSRMSMGDVILAGDDPWGTFAEAYLAASNRPAEPTST